MKKEGKKPAPLAGRFPKELGAAIDLAYQRRAARRKYERDTKKELDKLKADEAAIEAYIIDKFNVGEIEGAKGRLATAGITKSTHGNIVDFDKFTAWVAKNKAWDILTRKVNDKAYRARLDAKVRVPGVEPFHRKKLSLTKR